MKIGIDIQPLQSSESTGRGIGRYTQAVVEELLRRNSPINFQFFGNSDLPASSLDMSSLSCRWIGYPQQQNCPANRLLMKSVLMTADVEAMFFPSPVMGNDVTIPDFDGLPCKVFTICYDLIPLLFAERYLPDKTGRDFYMKRVNTLRHANLVFAISEATRQDTIRCLQIAPEKVINISSGVSDFFRPVTDEHALWRRTFAEKFNITRPFVMYTGGEDWRKNLRGLVNAFGLLPPDLKAAYQLVIACKLSQGGVAELTEAAARLGMADALVLTNFISDEELRALYSLCHLFVFPSLYEGFGLPVLEAMACGAPTLAGNNSSLPEIIGNPHQLFDSSSPAAIAAAMQAVLRDQDLRDRLAEEAPRRAAIFTWEHVAQRVEEAILRSHHQDPPLKKTVIDLRCPRIASGKPRIAYFSPLPPAKSGITDYSESLLPVLRKHVDIDLYHDSSYQPDADFIRRGDWCAFSASRFEANLAAREYEALLYQIGNSDNHVYMYTQLMRYGGITVLHDYHLGGLIAKVSSESKGLSGVFLEELTYNYGVERAQEIMRLLEQQTLSSLNLAQHEIHINRRIFTRSLGVIVHNRWAYDLAVRDFQDDCEDIACIPLATPPVQADSAAHSAMRERLGIPQGSFLVSVFGIVGHTKRPAAILKAFALYAQAYPQAHLVFAGHAYPDDEAMIKSEIKRLGLGGNVHLTGHVEMADFCRFIQASDVCLNLRFPYNGETSAALLQLFSYGKPVIVTDIGSFSEFPDDVVLKIPRPDACDEVQEIHRALTALTEHPQRRRLMGCNAAEYAAREHAPEHCARLYADFLQRVIHSPAAKRKMLADSVGREAAGLGPADKERFLRSFSKLMAPGTP